jgi:hypothetical protein
MLAEDESYAVGEAKASAEAHAKAEPESATSDDTNGETAIPS